MVESWDQEDVDPSRPAPATSFEVELEDDEEQSELPAPVLEALVDAAWCLRGSRVSFARLEGCALRILAAAGPQHPFDPGQRGLELRDLPRLRAALLTAGEPLSIEDVAHDFHTRAAPAALGATRALLIVPVPRARTNEPPFVVLVESARPRTWGKSEHAALERLLPLLSMASDSLALRVAHEELRHDLRVLERRASASTALGHILVDELRRTLAVMEPATGAALPLRDHALGLLEQLASTYGPRVGERIDEPLDLREVLFALLPRLRGLIGSKYTLDLSPGDGELPALHAFRPGVERLITHLLLLVTHADASRGDSRGGSIQVGVECLGPRLMLTIHGSIDERAVLEAVGGELSHWLVQMELQLLGASWIAAPSDALPKTARGGLVFPLRVRLP